MNDSNIENRLRTFIGGFVRGGRSFTDDQDIFRTGFVNSLFVMQLVLFVESNFDLTVDVEDMDIGNFSSIHALTRFIHAKHVDRSPPESDTAARECV